jgi:hypothetical protein
VIARFHFSNGFTLSIRESQAVIGLTKNINGNLERPTSVEFIEQVEDLRRRSWQRDCESAISNLKSEISNLKSESEGAA